MAYVKKLKYLFKPCKQCGLMMRGTAKQLSARVFCSQQCNADDRKAHNLRVCAECGANFHARLGGNSKTDGAGQYCSKVCFGAYISRAYKLHAAHVVEMRKALKRRANQVRKAERKAAKAPKPVVQKPSYYCAVGCGNATKRVGVRCPTCSALHDKSLRRASKAKRRAIERGALCDSIDPLRVFALAKWKCQSCGEKTPKSLRGSYESRAPEMDHIASLADGGSHTWANVQCLCRQCNLTKGARSVGQIGLGFF